MAEPSRRYLDAEVALENLEAVHELLEDWWGAVGDVPPRVRFGFDTAVIEIAGNIIEHSVRLDDETGRRFSLALTGTERMLHARFEDNGRPAGIDLSAVAMAGSEDENGRGLALAIASLDRLDYRFENGRNVWELECGRG